MAKYVMRHIVEEAGLSEQFIIEAAATSREEIGNPVYPPARRELSRHGITCEGHHARQLTAEDYEEYDYLIGMDEENLFYMHQICRTPEYQKMQEHREGRSSYWYRRGSASALQHEMGSRISLLMDYAGSTREVADPWYTGDFTQTWKDVWAGCTGLMEYLIKNGR